MKTQHLRWSSLAPLPGAILSLLPAVTCPACLGAYAGLLSALGLGFLVQSTVLEPLLIATLLIGLASIVWSTVDHRNPWPLALTLLGDVTVVSGRYLFVSELLQWFGFPLILAAAGWNIWLRRRRPGRQPGSTAENEQLVSTTETSR